MKKFNKIGKINTLYRIIAAVLVFAIALLAYPEVKEVRADEGTSSVDIIPEDYISRSVDVYADQNDKADVTFTSNSLHYVGFGETTANNYTLVSGTKIEFSNIERGTVNTYEILFDSTHMGPPPESYSHITIVVHGRKRDTTCSISSISSTITYGSMSGYANKSFSDFVTYSIEGNTNSPSFSCYVEGHPSETLTPDYKPLEPGSYVVTMDVPADDNYDYASKSTTVTISKYTPSLSIPDVGPGEAPHPSCTYATTGGSLATVDSFPTDGFLLSQPGIEYKGENDTTYSRQVPTEPGTYTARLTYESDSRLDDYNEGASTTFKISLKEGKGKVTVADTVYGESSVKPKAESDTNDADKAEFFYKVKNTEDSTYTKELPKKPGKYVCKAVFPKTGSYAECSTTCEFVIEKAKGVGTLTSSDVYVGMEPKLSPVSATNGVTAVTYQYKEKGAADSKYSDKLPTQPGEYTVKATFAATDYYLETSATAEFKTSYMPAPTFGLSGSQGKNNFYTDTVTIKAPSGYEVSLSYGKDYKDSINILDGVKYVYFKDKATGALSDKAAVPSYKMDSVLPVVKGVKNNDTIFKDEYELEVTDDYLEMVKVNDQTIPVKDGKATYKLTSDSGEMLYKIEATDQAGHTVTYTITVASPWVKDGFVPAGQIVKLKPGKAYSLKGGKKYKIKGDDTVYNGGTQFYVDEERELELEEYNEN